MRKLLCVNQSDWRKLTQGIHFALTTCFQTSRSPSRISGATRWLRRWLVACSWNRTNYAGQSDWSDWPCRDPWRHANDSASIDLCG
jgi:hypothetical protein